MQYSLGPSVARPIRRMVGCGTMQISQDLRRCVVFIGFADKSKPGGIDCRGTGFLLVYERRYLYLVTAKHIAVAIGDAPFCLRVNRKDGTADTIPVDGELTWFCHETDPDVDVAIAPFGFDRSADGADVTWLPDELLATPERRANQSVGIGDQCYTVGLFRLMSGEKRNLPVVHTGNIALLPSDERVPVQDWERPNDKTKRRFIEAFLVESQSLEGLSGSPVFVRPTILICDAFRSGDGVERAVNIPRNDLLLLGLWQGAWGLRPDEMLASGRQGLKVPVGMGVVVPAEKIAEVFEMPGLREQRKRLAERLESEAAAAPDMVPPTKAEQDDHKDRFNRLLDVAARKPKQGGQT